MLWNARISLLQGKKEEDIMDNLINNENGQNDQFENNQTFRAKIKILKHKSVKRNNPNLNN